MLGVEVELVKVSANDRIPFLASGKIDFVMAAMTRTPARAKVIDFTLPVHTEVLGVLTTDKKPFKDWKELNDPGVRLVSVRGTTGAAFIQKNLPKATLTLLDDQPENVTLIAQGRADAAISVIDFLGVHMNKHKVNWKVVDAPIEIYYCPAGVAKGNHTLRDWMNVAIYDLHRSRLGRPDLEEMVRDRHDPPGPGDALLLVCPVTMVRRLTACDARTGREAMSYTLQFGQVWHYLPYLPRRSLDHAPDLVPGVLGRDGDRAARRGRPHLWRPVEPGPGARLCRLLHEHAGAGPDLLLFLRDAGVRRRPDLLRGRAPRAHAQRRGLHHPHPAGRLPLGPSERTRRRGDARHEPVAVRALRGHPHIARVLYAPLSSKFILMVLGSAVGGVFGLEELTGRTINANSETFRAIELFSMTAVIYVALTILASALLAVIGRFVFRVKVSVL
jgi:hypothetical protein